MRSECQSGRTGGMDRYGKGGDTEANGVCVMSVHGPQTGRTGVEKQEFRNTLKKMLWIPGALM